MFRTSWNNADEQKELASINISRNSKRKPPAIIATVISAANYFSILLISNYYNQSLKSALRMQMFLTVISNIPTPVTAKTTPSPLTGKVPV